VGKDKAEGLGTRAPGRIERAEGPGDELSDRIPRAEGPDVCLAQAEGLGTRAPDRIERAEGPTVCQDLAEPACHANGARSPTALFQQTAGPAALRCTSHLQPSPLGWARQTTGASLLLRNGTSARIQRTEGLGNELSTRAHRAEGPGNESSTRIHRAEGPGDEKGRRVRA
jgi:hypothetical protein